MKLLSFVLTIVATVSFGATNASAAGKTPAAGIMSPSGASHRHAFLRASKGKCPKPEWIFASDRTTGNVDEFCEDAPGPNQPNALFAVCFGCGGEALAVSPATQQLAIGTHAETVTTWTVAANGIPAQASTLKLSGSGTTPEGICYDGTGGLYVTNYPTNAIDYFTAASVAGPGPFAATGSWLTQNLMQPVDAACDFDSGASENILLINGIDVSGNTSLSLISAGTGPVGAVPVADAISFTYGSPTVFLAGGLALNRRDNLIIANEYGSLNDMGKSEPWVLPPNPVCTGLGSYIGHIAFDRKQHELWAADDYYTGGGMATKVISVRYPFGNAACSPGTSGVVAIPSNGETWFAGLALYKNSGV